MLIRNCFELDYDNYKQTEQDNISFIPKTPKRSNFVDGILNNIFLAGCSKTVIEQIQIKNGRWHCPLHDDDDDLIGPGLQCFATCDERYDLHDSQGGYYSMNILSSCV